MAKVGIIGGSGLYEIEGIEDSRRIVYQAHPVAGVVQDDIDEFLVPLFCEVELEIDEIADEHFLRTHDSGDLDCCEPHEPRTDDQNRVTRTNNCTFQCPPHTGKDLNEASFVKGDMIGEKYRVELHVSRFYPGVFRIG